MEYSYNYEYGTSEGNPMVNVISLALNILTLVAMWKVYTKAGWQGWEAIVPFYNLYVMFKMAGLRGVEMLWLLVPFVNIYYIIKVYNRISRAFGKNGWFTVGILFFPYIFWPILGFTEAQYTAPTSN
jgi:hypothetical protein